MVDDEGTVRTPVEVEYDAGDLAGGELAAELRRRLVALQPGDLLRVRATDPGAPEAVPAWCRSAGHRLEGEDPPWYRIRRRRD